MTKKGEKYVYSRKNSIVMEDKQRDRRLWRVAKKRVAFRRHFFAYLIVNSFLWLLWFWQTGGRSYANPWPLWVTFGWGIGVAFNYYDAFHGRGSQAIEKEYDKLNRKG